MIAVTLYTTAGCHLCELADAILQSISTNNPLAITHVEIGDDDSLTERYGITIPVVQFEDDTEFNWPFSKADLEAKLIDLSE
ncbi:MAG: glutaredoxin family protein [Gammaproteobacteria bacterium]|nr:glutaredoxin family protein [Gammaproteobacteria bacterium]